MLSRQSNRRRRRLAPGLGACLALALPWAAAQTAPHVPPFAPIDAATLATPVHRSAFSRYGRFDDQPLSSWTDANETVARIGGWRAYAREAQQFERAREENPRGASQADGMRKAEDMREADGRRRDAPHGHGHDHGDSNARGAR